MLERVNRLTESLSDIDCINTFKRMTLQQFKKLFHLEHAIFWLADCSNVLHSPTTQRIDWDLFMSYRDYYYEQDPLLPKNIITRRKLPRFLTILDVTDKEIYENSEYYNGFMRPQRLKNELGLYLYSNNELIGGISFASNNYDLGKTQEERVAFHILSRYISLQLETMNRKTYTQIKMSEAEKRVFERLLKGETDQKIAEQLHLSIHTVKKHLRNLYEKNNVTNRTALIALANRSIKNEMLK